MLVELIGVIGVVEMQMQVDNYQMQGILFEDNQRVKLFFKELVLGWKGLGICQKLSVSKCGYDLEQTQTLKENFKLKKIPLARIKQLIHDYQNVPLNEKIINVSAFEQACCRVIYGISDADILFVDELFTYLSYDECDCLKAFIESVSQQLNVIIIVVEVDVEKGVYFDRLYGLNSKGNKIIPLKDNDKEARQSD